jgi:Putative beta-barrel porin 2
MRHLSILLLALFFLALVPLISQAQEAVSTSSSSTSSSTTSTSSSTSTVDVSAETNAPSAAVTNAPSAETSVQGGPSGVGVFSRTPVKIFASISGGYDDNVNTVQNQKQGSAFTSGDLILDYTFGDPRLQLVLNAGAGGTYYYERLNSPAPTATSSPAPKTQEYDIDLKGALGITYKASPRLTLGSTILVEYLTEPDFSNPSGRNSRNGNYLYTTDKIFGSYLWTNRFSTKTSYELDAFNYDNSAVAIYSNSVSNTFGNEFRFQLVPTTLLVAEYRYEVISYEHEGEVIIPAVFLGPFKLAPAVRLQADSTTHFALGGIDHMFNPRLSLSLRGGAEFRSYADGGDRSSPYFEGSLTYAAGRRVTVSWNNRYGIEEPATLGAQGRTTFRTGLHGKFDLTSRINSTFDVYYTRDDYHSLNLPTAPVAPFTEDSIDAGVGLRYAITSLVGVQAGYHYTDITSDLIAREYSRNRVYAGVSVTF